MFQIPQRQYLPNPGEKVLPKGKYDQGAADTQANNRSLANQQALPNTFTLPSQTFISQMAQAQTPPQAQPSRMVQLFNQAMSQPLQQVQTTAQNMAQQMNQILGQMNIPLPGFMEKAITQAFSFFFGNSKESGKDDSTEREKRNRNDDVLPDSFGDIAFGANKKVEQKPNTGLGSGSK